MGEEKEYLDLIKAHKIFVDLEGRWKFYDAYMNNRDADCWFTSGTVPLKEGLLLFGFISSWDPNFRGDLTKFLDIYKKVFPTVRELLGGKIESIKLSAAVKEAIASVFNAISYCPKGGRREYTDTSKILHAILPNLFVMWDIKIRKGVLGEDRRDGETYACVFLPKMQKEIVRYVKSYAEQKGVAFEVAGGEISRMASGYTLAKLMDEYNYVRYTKRKSIGEIRRMTV